MKQYIGLLPRIVAGLIWMLITSVFSWIELGLTLVFSPHNDGLTRSWKRYKREIIADFHWMWYGENRYKREQRLERERYNRHRAELILKGLGAPATTGSASPNKLVQGVRDRLQSSN